MDDARHLQALRGVASPHRAHCADLAQTRGADRNGAFYEIFTRLESQTGQTAEVFAAMFVDVTPAGGAQPSATGCRTPPEWLLGGVFHAALQIESWFRKARRRTASTRLG